LADDLYKTLGVSKRPLTTRSRRLTRKLARSTPDRNPDDAAAEEKFKEIQGLRHALGS